MKGDKGDAFYIVERGSCVASKVMKFGDEPEIVYAY